MRTPVVVALAVWMAWSSAGWAAEDVATADRVVRGLASAEQAVIAADWEAAAAAIDAADVARGEAGRASDAAQLIRIARVHLAIASAHADRARLALARRILEGVVAGDPQAGTGVEARLALERQVVPGEAALAREAEARSGGDGRDAAGVPMAGGGPRPER